MAVKIKVKAQVDVHRLAHLRAEDRAPVTPCRTTRGV
jgi:hypothetical protein